MAISAALIFLVMACNESNIIFEETVPPNQIRSRSSSGALDYFAKALAKAQGSAALRTFIKNTASQNPWNDNCLVYGMYYNDVISDSSTLADILYANRDQADNRFGATFFAEDIFQYYPTLSIYVYTGDEDLDVQDFNTSLITGAFEIPEDHTSIDSILVYEMNYTLLNPILTSYSIDAENEPSEQYLCVGPNSSLLAFDADSFNMYNFEDYQLEERLGLPRNSLCEDLITAILSNTPASIEINGTEVLLYDPQAILDLWCELCDVSGSIICNTDPGSDIENCTEECDRDCSNNLEEICRYTFTHQHVLRQTCSWTRAWCNFHITAVWAVNTSATPTPVNKLTKFDSAKRKNLKGWNGNWHYPSSPLLFLRWNLSDHSDPMKYAWFYDHPKEGTKTNHTINYTGKIIPILDEVIVGGSVSIMIEPKDIDCGEDLIYYCDDADGCGTEYNTGKIKFFVKEQEE